MRIELLELTILLCRPVRLKKLRWYEWRKKREREMALDGMGMLAKSLGFDAKEIAQTIETAKVKIPEFASAIDARVSVIEKKIDIIIKLLTPLENEDVKHILGKDDTKDAGRIDTASGERGSGSTGD